MMHIELEGQPPIALPAVLLTNLRAVHGERVDAWIGGLASMLGDVLAELDACIVPDDPGLSYHLVFFARRSNGEDIVVKCTVPNEEQAPEVAGVEALSDAGIGPRLLWSDLERGVLAMERVVPGGLLPTHLPTLPEDAEIVRSIGSLAARMAREIDVSHWRDRLITVREYSKALDVYDPNSAVWNDHRDKVDRARALRDAMLASPERRDVFLHGDLHHYNILSDAGGRLKVIDPKGLIGPAGYDFGVMSYDPMGIQHHPDLAALFRQRVKVWSEAAGLPWYEVRDWGYVGAMLSACWDSEDGSEGYHDTLRSAITMREISPPG